MIRARFNAVMLVCATAACGIGACRDEASGSAGSRETIRVVGSSTVFPFTTIVAENLVDRMSGVPSPAIEETGTGAGMKLFCAGVGAAHPDIADASRQMKASEYAACRAHGVADVIEVQIGLDGVAFAEAKDGPKLRLTPVDLYRALAATPGGRANTARTWRDVNPSLPAVPIQIYGPPATSGTRDAIVELILAKGCIAADPAIAASRETHPANFARRCTSIREDGAYVDAGENDNFVVQKLQSNPDAVGIFGYSYLAQNKDRLAGIPLDGIEPTYETIAQGRYPGSRPLFLYVKKAHLRAVPHLRDFVRLYARSWEPSGPLVAKGLIAAPQDVRDRAARIVADETPLDPAGLR